jgi:hypothetical protein
MELGPELIALLTRLQGLDPASLDDLLQDANGAPGAIPAVAVAPVVAPALPGIRIPLSNALPRSILEKFRVPEADPLLAHYATYLPAFNQVHPGSEEAQFADILTLAEAERPILVVGVMRNNVPELVPLWGPARHLDPPYSRTSAHEAPVIFCRDVVRGNLPASARFDCDWLVTEALELLAEDVFLAKIINCALGATSVPEAILDNREDLYVAQAAVLPACLVPDLLLLRRDPVAAWRLLRARATTLGLL